MSESILSPGKTISYSSTFTVEEGTSVLISVYTGEGTDVGSGPVLVLQFQDINGEWLDVSTQPYGAIRFHQLVQHFVISTEGTYRVYRPDLKPWNFNVGIEIYRFSNDGVPFTPTPSPVICTDIPFDHAVAILSWTPTNGEDLDPHMAVTTPSRNNYVGWNRQPSDETYLYWGGDSQTTMGAESFLIDMPALKAAYPNLNTFSLILTAFWYTRVGDGNIKITLKTYSGGTMENQNNIWTNVGGTEVSSEDYFVNCNMQIYGNEDKFGLDLGNVSYNFCDQNLTFNVNIPAITPTVTPTATVTPSVSVSPTITPTVTRSATVTPTVTPTRTVTPSITPTISVTPSITPTISVTPSITPSLSVTATPTRTPTRTATATPTPTATQSITPTISVTPTNTRTPTVTPTITPTISVTPSITPTISVTPTNTRTPTITPSLSVTSSVTPTVTPTLTPTRTATRTITPTPTVTVSQTLNNTPTPTRTVSITPSVSLTPSITPTISVTPTITATISVTPTPTITTTQTPDPTPGVSKSLTPTVTPTITASISVTPTQTPTPTTTPTVTATPTPSPVNQSGLEWEPVYIYDSPDADFAVYNIAYAQYLGKYAASSYRAGVGISDDGVNWTYPENPTGIWTGLTWSEVHRKFIAYNGTTLVYSDDAVNWTVSNVPSMPTVRDIVYSESLNTYVAFLATPANTSCYTSTNGTSWTQRTMPAGAWRGAWSPVVNRFVAVSSNASSGERAAYSANGITWTPVAVSGTAVAFQTVIWSTLFNRFIAAGYTNRAVMYSTNGTSWYADTSITNYQWLTVAESVELGFVMMAGQPVSGVPRTMITKDGSTWIPTPDPIMDANGGWLSLNWSSDRFQFLAGGQANSVRIARALSTIVPVPTTTPTHTPTPTPTVTPTTSSPPLPLAFSNPTLPAGTKTGYAAVAIAPSINTIVVSGAADQMLYSSNNGGTWNVASNGQTAGLWNGIAWSPELNIFVALSYDSSRSVQIITSPNGITWTARTRPSASEWRSVAWSAEQAKFVAVSGSGVAMTSTNGVTWAATPAPPSGNWVSVVWAKELNLFVAVAYGGRNQVMTSPNGTAWTARSIPTAAQGKGWWSLTWAADKSLLVAVSYDGNVMTSSDGITWTLTGKPTSELRTVSYSQNKGMFVTGAQTTGSRILSSYDAISWTPYPNITSGNYYASIWSDALGAFLVIASNGVPATITYATPTS